MDMQSIGIEIVYGRPLDYSKLVHKHTISGFDSRKLVKVYFDLAELNYVIMSWHCLCPEYQKDSFTDSYSEALLVANQLFYS